MDAFLAWMAASVPEWNAVASMGFGSQPGAAPNTVVDINTTLMPTGVYKTGAAGDPLGAAWSNALLALASGYSPETAGNVFLSVTKHSGVPRVFLGQKLSTADPIFWDRVITNRNVVAPVAQSGGVPTNVSGIIERGSNANGDYVRFADGTQICSYIHGPGVIMTSAAASLYAMAAQETWTFPAAFVYANSMVPSGAAGVAYAFAGFGTPTATSVPWRCYSLFSEGTLRYPRLMAVGRWY